MVKMVSFVLCIFYHIFQRQNELLSHEKSEMNLKHILLSERSLLYTLWFQWYNILGQMKSTEIKKKKISGFQEIGWRGGRLNRWRVNRYFRTRKLFCMILDKPQEALPLSSLLSRASPEWGCNGVVIHFYLISAYCAYASINHIWVFPSVNSS